METKTLLVRAAWVPLEGVENGTYLQKLSGAILYYSYAERRPLPSVEGHEFTSSDGSTPLLGGKIWVRSRGETRIAYTPAYIAPDTPGALIGDLTHLLTADKSNVVSAVNELKVRCDSMQTQIDALGSDAGGEDGTVGASGGLVYSGDITLNATHIANRSVALPFTPVVESFKLDVIGGIRQHRNVDYQVLGNSIAWSGLAMELYAEIGTVLSIFYIRG